MRLSLGDQVTTPNGAQAILRWTGRIQGKPIEYAGVELLKGTGLHSGEHNGVKYFEVARPNSGLFVSYSKLVSANVVTPLSSLGETRLPQREAANSDKARLEALLEEREAKIRELKLQIEERREEFRTHLASIEADRNQLAEHYEGLLREYTGGDVLESQRAALAAMQNSLMEENALIKEQLEAERAKTKSQSGDKIPDDLEAVLSQLTAQQELIADLESDAKELDTLRAQNLELKTRCEEMEHALSEVESLKVAMQELELQNRSSDKNVQKEVEDLRAQLKDSKDSQEAVAALRLQVKELTAELAASKEAKPEPQASSAETEALKKQVLELTASVASQKRRADKATSDAQMAQKDAQMYFKMSDPDLFESNKKRIAELESQVMALEEKLEAASSAAPAVSAPPSIKAPVASVAKSEEDLEREMEDQILREAGLLEDAAVAGREQWCGLCERSGHTSIECPYE